MAVAADFHRDFLIPERVLKNTPDNERLRAFQCSVFILLFVELYHSSK